MGDEEFYDPLPLPHGQIPLRFLTIPCPSLQFCPLCRASADVFSKHPDSLTIEERNSLEGTIQRLMEHDSFNRLMLWMSSYVLRWCSDQTSEMEKVVKRMFLSEGFVSLFSSLFDLFFLKSFLISFNRIGVYDSISSKAIKRKRKGKYDINKYLF